MSKLLDALAQIQVNAKNVGTTLLDAVVVAVNTPYDVDVSVLGETVTNVPCLKSYSPRNVDDVVLVLASEKRLIVVGSVSYLESVGE